MEAFMLYVGTHERGTPEGGTGGAGGPYRTTADTNPNDA
jgi:GTPase involved in cell partitioning and DNA repair